MGVTLDLIQGPEDKAQKPGKVRILLDSGLRQNDTTQQFQSENTFGNCYKMPQTSVLPCYLAGGPDRIVLVPKAQEAKCTNLAFSVRFGRRKNLFHFYFS